MIELVDTHAHIHFKDYGLDPDEVLSDAKKQGVGKIIVVGCDLETSKNGVLFAEDHKNVWASVGVHPHYAKDFSEEELRQIRNLLDQAMNKNTRQSMGQDLANANLLSPVEPPTRSSGSADVSSPNPHRLRQDKVVAVGEVGLDYYYENSPKQAQAKMLEEHLQLAREFGLPVIFHVRDAYDDFWPIYDNFAGLRGVVHSFSASVKELDEALNRGLYIGLNGIMTFTKDEKQLQAAKRVPKGKMILETDAPYLTPNPFRGKICRPEHVRLTAEFLATLRDEQLEELASYSTSNANELFNLN